MSYVGAYILLNTINKYLFSFWKDTNKSNDNTLLELRSTEDCQNVYESVNDSLKDRREKDSIEPAYEDIIYPVDQESTTILHGIYSCIKNEHAL